MTEDIIQIRESIWFNSVYFGKTFEEESYVKIGDRFVDENFVY